MDETRLGQAQETVRMELIRSKASNEKTPRMRVVSGLPRAVTMATLSKTKAEQPVSRIGRHKSRMGVRKVAWEDSVDADENSVSSKAPMTPKPGKGEGTQEMVSSTSGEQNMARDMHQPETPKLGNISGNSLGGLRQRRKIA
jgi:hypothetical protein